MQLLPEQVGLSRGQLSSVSQPGLHSRVSRSQYSQTSSRPFSPRLQRRSAPSQGSSSLHSPCTHSPSWQVPSGQSSSRQHEGSSGGENLTQTRLEASYLTQVVLAHTADRPGTVSVRAAVSHALTSITAVTNLESSIKTCTDSLPPHLTLIVRTAVCWTVCCCWLVCCHCCCGGGGHFLGCCCRSRCEDCRSQRRGCW